ncbi:hypothetical protein, variant [Cladophialophora immunda]|uniref:BTB domain-containing protein n=1 Tax=Cladophialophora immunda TaxID=569365 RepID=A0A0D2AB10_9EURO|nr:uncharacterized protein PV07_12645 [Cladophialophora immunda]XP_016242168.1 hypothetical protein, variant [Cladophialophora immunda]KIW21951.1 hypothetical protein PV07_12645 [Cladophialophora immunda]KIW21952.1 hypothetical protein, variant [Cladophialophora immunda]
MFRNYTPEEQLIDLNVALRKKDYTMASSLLHGFLSKNPNGRTFQQCCMVHKLEEESHGPNCCREEFCDEDHRESPDAGRQKAISLVTESGALDIYFAWLAGQFPERKPETLRSVFEALKGQVDVPIDTIRMFARCLISRKESLTCGAAVKMYDDEKEKVFTSWFQCLADKCQGRSGIIRALPGEGRPLYLLDQNSAMAALAEAPDVTILIRSEHNTEEGIVEEGERAEQQFMKEDRLHVHSTWVFPRFRWLEKCLSSGMKESADRTIDLTNEVPRVVRRVLLYTYTGIYDVDFFTDDHLFHVQMFAFAELHSLDHLRDEALRRLWMSLSTLDGQRDTICVRKPELSISDQDKLSEILEALEDYQGFDGIVRMATRVLHCVKGTVTTNKLQRFYLESAFVPMLTLTCRKEDPENICFDCPGRWMWLEGCIHGGRCKNNACVHDTMCEACYGKPGVQEQVQIV